MCTFSVNISFLDYYMQQAIFSIKTRKINIT